MGWARIDDAFDDHEKVLALLDLDEGMAALGLWTLCLTYAHRNTRKKGKTPGSIPATLPRRFGGSDGKAWAGLLVEVGLWDEVDDGWMIHDFAEYLPGKEVSAARSAAGKRGAASRWGNKRADGKLPSSDGNANGKPMASDGSEMAEGASPPDEASVVPGEDEVDVEVPSDDGNLPSESHSEDDKSMASDGSRAGAHRVRAWEGVKGSDRTSVTHGENESPPPESESDDEECVLLKLPVKPKPPECGSDQDPDFVAFWTAYPRKVGKPSARTAWRRAIKDRTDPAVIIAAAAEYRDDPERRRSPKRFTPHPSTWLNDARFDPEPEDEDDGNLTWDDVEEKAPREFN